MNPTPDAQSTADESTPAMHSADVIFYFSARCASKDVSMRLLGEMQFLAAKRSTLFCEEEITRKQPGSHFTPVQSRAYVSTMGQVQPQERLTEQESKKGNETQFVVESKCRNAVRRNVCIEK